MIPEIGITLRIHKATQPATNRMQQFTIKDVERLSGVKAHTLRVWEQRYGLVVPYRKDSNHRLYSNEDLKAILRVVYLYNNGYKISKIAHLRQQELIEFIQQNTTGVSAHEVAMLQLLEACIDFDEIQFDAVFAQTERTLGFSYSIEQVIYPFLQRIGMLWMSDKLMPAQEHFASNLVRKKLLAAIESLPRALPRPGKPVILLFTPEGEYHELPLLFTKYLYQKNGIATIYFGAHIPVECLLQYTGKQYASHLHFHLITNFGQADHDTYLQYLCRSFPAQTIISSGPLNEYVKQVPANGRLINSLPELYSFINSLVYQENADQDYLNQANQN